MILGTTQQSHTYIHILLRSIVGVAILMSVYMFPAWVVMCLAVLWMVFSGAYELIAIGFVLDSLYSVTVSKQHLVYTAALFICFGVVRFIRSHIRTYNT